MTNLNSQRRLAAQILKIGQNRVWIDPERIGDVEGAITREEVRKLIHEKIIVSLPEKGVSRSRAKTIRKKKGVGRRKGPGSRTGSGHAKISKKEALMARGSSYRVPLRRRREGKTDYQARKALILSGKPRLVSRSSGRNIIVEIVVGKPRGDEVLAAAHSSELKKAYGWKASTGNVPAAYLTGLLCGLKAKSKGVEEAVLDIGLVAPTKGAKVFATLSGVLDAGVDVPHTEEKNVEERTEGAHIAE